MTSPVRALVLVDVQLEYFGGPLEIQHPPHGESLPQVVRAVDAATAAGAPRRRRPALLGRGGGGVRPARPSGFRLHPEVERRRQDGWVGAVKQFGTVFAGTDVLERLQERGVDTVTFVGYMTNNCILASAAEAETHGLAAEVLSDATGAISLANDAGAVDARTLHTTLMTLLHSNFAAVATTAAWCDAVAAGTTLPGGDLGSSAVEGRARAGSRRLTRGVARTGQESRSPDAAAVPSLVVDGQGGRPSAAGRHTMGTTTERAATDGFTAEERAAMKERAAELRAEGKKGAKKADGLQAVLDRIAQMAPADRALAERVHFVVTSAAPQLAPKTWYGMPAYADEKGKAVVFFQDAAKFGARYATLGFQDNAALDDGDMWPASFALVAWTPEVEARVRELVARAVS